MQEVGIACSPPGYLSRVVSWAAASLVFIVSGLTDFLGGFARYVGYIVLTFIRKYERVPIFFPYSLYLSTMSKK